MTQVCCGTVQKYEMALTLFKFRGLISIVIILAASGITFAKKLDNITAAIETLKPDAAEIAEYKFEDSVTSMEAMFESSDGTSPFLDYRLFIAAQFVIWYFYWRW